MSITYDSILEKVSLELQKAQQAAGHEQMMSHIYAIKTLTEVILDAKGQEKVIERQEASVSNQDQKHVIQVSNTAETVKFEDGANGDSIFDF